MHTRTHTRIIIEQKSLTKPWNQMKFVTVANVCVCVILLLLIIIFFFLYCRISYNMKYCCHKHPLQFLFYLVAGNVTSTNSNSNSNNNPKKGCRFVGCMFGNDEDDDDGGGGGGYCSCGSYLVWKSLS